MFGLMGLRGSSGPGPDTVARGGGGGGLMAAAAVVDWKMEGQI